MYPISEYCQKLSQQDLPYHPLDSCRLLPGIRIAQNCRGRKRLQSFIISIKQTSS
jgi:hypothetical protein